MMKCSNLGITELQVGPGGGCRKERKNPNCQGKRYETCQDEFFKSPHVVCRDRGHGHDERHEEDESVGELHRTRDQRMVCDEFRVSSPIVSNILIREQQFPIDEGPPDCRCGIAQNSCGKYDQYVL